ncbi:Pancreatic lipase-related protein 2 [Halotydeus destructor]|nr:Pancreatic lipase-related protein 2 [Halotydeus destructor]
MNPTSIFDIISLSCIIIQIVSTKCDPMDASPLDPTMISLVNHDRLLGFIAMMDEPLHHLKIQPEQPAKIQTKFSLLDAGAIIGDLVITKSQDLSYKNPIKMKNAMKGKYNKIYFVAHDFQEAFEGKYLDLVHELLKYKQQEKPAVVAVDWRIGAQYKVYSSAQFPELDTKVYGPAVANTIVVGREVALLTYYMTKHEVIKRQDVHYIGLGLGAQVMHVAGQYYTYLDSVDHENVGGPSKGGKVGRITGLDPSARDFQGYRTTAKIPYLNRQDAELVDIIHTSSVKHEGNEEDSASHRIGMSVLSGHVDFYPNGGQEQPFCKGIPRCSHERALHYFKASIMADMTVSKRLFALGANSYQEYLDLKPGGRSSFFGSMFKPKPKVSSSFGATYMGIQAMALLKLPTDKRQYGLFLDFALDGSLKPAVVQTAGQSELQLIDIVRPAILTKELYDLSKFPVHSSIKTSSLNPLEIPGCGRFLAPPVDDSRVHAGLEPYAKQFPWNVCVAPVTDTKQGSFVYIGCSGSLITPDFVVTAAHCFDQYSLRTWGHPRLRQDNRPVYLLFGTDCQRPLLYRQVPLKQGVTIFFHPDYLVGTQMAETVDLALIRLPSPIPAAMLPVNGQFTNETTLNTVCWRTSSVFDYDDKCEELYFAGHGTNNDATLIKSDLLKWFIMKLDGYYAADKRTVKANDAEHHKLRDTCPGDSGGPLTQIFKATGGLGQLYDKVSPYTATIVGTVVGGPPPCNAGQYTVFVAVGHEFVYSWIKATVANNTSPITADLKPGHVDFGIDYLLQNG